MSWVHFCLCFVFWGRGWKEDGRGQPVVMWGEFVTHKCKSLILLTWTVYVGGVPGVRYEDIITVLEGLFEH